MSQDIIYPTNLSKYDGSILQRKQAFLVRIRGVHNITKTFKSYEEAFQEIKSFNIQHNLIKNLIYDRGDYYEIELTQGKTMFIDKEDLELFDEKCVYAHQSSTTNTLWYAYITVQKKTISVHRLIYEKHFGEIPKDMLIDHILNEKDGGLDNRKQNIRLVTASLNSRNKKITNNTSGTICIYEHKQSQKWFARFTYNKQMYNSALFITKNEAEQWLLITQQQVIQDTDYAPNRIIINK